MADETGEEQLNNPPNFPPENPFSKTTADKDTINPNQETENMEVHKHPHHVTHKKKWGEYLLEFLMLFLAVFLGFIAENIRESSVERHREKEFIQSFIEDLKTDTAAIQEILSYRENKKEKMDSLMLLLSTNKVKGFENEVYYFGRILMRSIPFQSNDRTITQLKNSGGLRLIRSEQAADSMIAYQKMVEEITTNEGFERTERNNSYAYIMQMFDPYAFDKMVTLQGISRPLNNPPLRSYDPQVLKNVAFYVHAVKGSILNLQDGLTKLKLKANNTIVFLQKEYHLEYE